MRTLLLAQNELVRRIRSRAALVTAFVAPLALAVVFGLLISGAGNASFTIAIVDADGSQTTEAIVSGFTSSDTDSGPVTFEAREGGDVRAAVNDGEVDAAIVFPAGFGAAATSGQPTRLEVLQSPDRAIAGQVAESIAQSVAADFDRVNLALATKAAVTGSPPDLAAITAISESPPALAFTETEAGGKPVSGTAFFGASMSILFLFFTVGFGARSLVAEKRGGTLARVMSTPTRPAEVITGKTLAVSALAVAGFLTVWGATTLFFGADWGDPLGVLVTIVATVFATAGIALFVSSLAKTEQQADSYTSAVTFVLALLGGNFLPPGSAPSVLDRLALLTPNGWALRAFSELNTESATMRSVGLSFVILIGFGVLFGALGVLRVNRGILR